MTSYLATYNFVLAAGGAAVPLRRRPVSGGQFTGDRHLSAAGDDVIMVFGQAAVHVGALELERDVMHERRRDVIYEVADLRWAGKQN